MLREITTLDYLHQHNLIMEIYEKIGSSPFGGWLLLSEPSTNVCNNIAIGL
jgi:hypothetical protein